MLKPTESKKLSSDDLVTYAARLIDAFEKQDSDALTQAISSLGEQLSAVIDILVGDKTQRIRLQKFIFSPCFSALNPEIQFQLKNHHNFNLDKLTRNSLFYGSLTWDKNHIIEQLTAFQALPKQQATECVEKLIKSCYMYIPEALQAKLLTSKDCHEIASKLIELGSLDYALYFLFCDYLILDSKERSLHAIFELIVSNKKPGNRLEDYRSFFLHEIKEKIKDPEIIFAILDLKDCLTVPEKYFLVSLVEKMSLSPEKKLHYTLKLTNHVVTISGYTLAEITRTAKSINKIDSGDFAQLEKLCTQPNMSASIFTFLAIHDQLAASSSVTPICSKITQHQSVEQLADHYGSEQYYKLTKAKGGIEREQDLALCIVCANYRKNFKLLDLIINDFLENSTNDFSSIKPLREITKYLGMDDEVVDYIYRTRGDSAVLKAALLYSMNPYTLRKLEEGTFIDLISNLKHIDLLESSLMRRHHLFTDEFINKLKTLPQAKIATRIVFLNQKLGFHESILDAAIALEEDDLALEVYKLGSRKTKQAEDRPFVLILALNRNCHKLTSYLLANDSSLRSGNRIKEEVLSCIINLARSRLSKLSGFSKEEALLLIEKIFITDSLNKQFDPLNNLINATNMSFLLEKIPADSDKLDTYYPTLQYNYLLLRTLISRNPSKANAYLKQIFSAKADRDRDCFYLLLRHSKFISYINQTVAIETKARSMQPCSIPLQASAGNTNYPKITQPKFINVFITKHPETASLLLSLLAKQYALATDPERPALYELYLIFDHYILDGEFNSPIIFDLLTCLPAFSMEAELSAQDYLVLRTFQVIRTAFSAKIEQLQEELESLCASNSRFVAEVNKTGRQKVFFDLLPEYLHRLRPEATQNIVTNFKPLQVKIAPTPLPEAPKNDDNLPKKKKHKIKKPAAIQQDQPKLIVEEPVEKQFEDAVKADDLQRYKKLIREHQDYFNKNKLDQVLAACGDTQKAIFNHLLKNQLNKSLDTNQKMKILKHIINNGYNANLELALSCDIGDTKSVNPIDRSSLFLYALDNNQVDCAEILMPTIVPKNLLIAAAKLGSPHLFERALNANSRLDNKDDDIVTYEELETLCINDKDKLTVIALARLRYKLIFQDQFGPTKKISRYKVKSKNPSGEDLFSTFKHQLEILKSYAKTHADKQPLTPDDLKACDLALKELATEYEHCGIKNIQRFLHDDALHGQLIPYMIALKSELKGLSQDTKLADDAIKRQLEFINEFRSKQSKPDPLPAVAASSEKVKKKKKLKHKVAKKPAAMPDESRTPIVIAKRSLYSLHDETQDQRTTQVDKPLESSNNPAVWTSCLLSIQTEIDSTLDTIRNQARSIENFDELETIPDFLTNNFKNHYEKLKQLFWELDEDLDSKSSFYETSMQLKLLDCSEIDHDCKRQMYLIAKQLLIQSSHQSTSIKADVKERTTVATFFKPAILEENITKFFSSRLKELQLFLSAAEIDSDSIHCCVFRMMNALGETYRPARMIRHLLIHQFHNIDRNNLLTLATALLKVDLANRSTFLAIERSAIYDQSKGFLDLILRPQKSEKVDYKWTLQNLYKKSVQLEHEGSAPKILWNVVLIGELLNKVPTTKEHLLSHELLGQCRMIRNKVAHEDYNKLVGEDTLAGEVPLSLLTSVSKSLCAAIKVKDHSVSAPAVGI